MLHLKKATEKDFDAVYADMLTQFPKEELKPREILSAHVKNGVYEFLKAFNGETPVGYALLFKADGYLFIDYIAVYKPYHSNGYGGQMLEALKNFYPDESGCFLEVEKIDPKKENTSRRVSFYKKHGAALLSEKYLYPNEQGALPMDLYYIPYKGRMPQNDETKNFITTLFKSLHNDLPHINGVIEKIFN